MKTDLEIARTIPLQPIADIAARYGLPAEHLRPYGRHMAKVEPTWPHALGARPAGLYVSVTAVSPTPLGEGKTTSAIGLAMGLERLGKRALVTLRQASMGPVFGVKGGAHGGGRALILPIEDVNLGLTGDIDAVAAAHNLLAARLDSSLLLGNETGLDPSRVRLKRVVDMNDRALRQIVTGLGGRANGLVRESGFDIAVASEVMAILALAEDAADLRARLGRMVVGERPDRSLVTAEELGAAGAMAALLRHAIKPTLVQTAEGGGALVHAGPFANIAHGNSSVIADRLGLSMADVVITESGFGADLGFEKLMHIKAASSGLVPRVVVLVATVRALKMHSGRFKVRAGKPLPDAMLREDLDALTAGAENLRAHLDIVRRFCLPVVVALNRFPTDTDAELGLLADVAFEHGAQAAVPLNSWAQGGPGAEALADAVLTAASAPTAPRRCYESDAPLATKIVAVATEVYGADSVRLEPGVAGKIKRFEDAGFGHLPICCAKTHASLSADPAALGRPRGFTLPIVDAELYAGAGFVTVKCGDIRTMPGLGSRPALLGIDLLPDGTVTGVV
jgi:formate--tetrahydrofolate ligase